MIVMDQILIGNSTIGNYVVGFFDCRANDGENAEDQVLRAYRRLGYHNVRPYRMCGCLEGVIHEGLNEREPCPEGYEQAKLYAERTIEPYLIHVSEAGTHLEVVDLIKKYRFENFVKETL